MIQKNPLFFPCKNNYSKTRIPSPTFAHAHLGWAGSIGAPSELGEMRIFVKARFISRKAAKYYQPRASEASPWVRMPQDI